MISVDKHNGYYLYFHIPFCSKKCTYCFYNSFVPQKKTLVDEYLGYLEKEIKLKIKEKYLFPVDVLYIGGGTPNYLSDKQLELLLQIIQRNFNLVAVKEFTVEMNPAFCTEKQLKLLKRFSVTRISFGIQTLNVRILKAVNRNYAEDSSEIILVAKHMGFLVNLDFMFGLPYQKSSDVDGAIGFIEKVRPALCTFHELRIGTNEIVEADKQGILSYTEVTAFYEKFTRELKEVGYVQFAPELFSLQEKISLCNYGNNWWARGKIIGFGVSAFSQLGNAFTKNMTELGDYYASLDEGRNATKFEYIFDLKELAILNFVSMITAGFAVDIKEIRRKYGINILAILDWEIAELLKSGVLLLKNDLLLLNPDKFIFSTPTIPFLLRRFDYLVEIWDVASGAPDKFRFTIKGKKD